jgi:superoxide reductase
MKNDRQFFRCSHCGNLVEMVENSGASIICCGEPMAELKANTVDAAKEKHVPVATKESGKLKVAVGAVPHPMTQEHHIAWIAVAEGKKTTRVMLDVPDGAPEAEFCADGGPVTVYAYCNLHGLWAVDVD